MFAKQQSHIIIACFDLPYHTFMFHPSDLHFRKNSGGLFCFLAQLPDFFGLSLSLRIFRRQRNLSEKSKGEMSMTIFEAVKSTVTPRMAAEHFGLSVSRNGMVCCPFHDDRHPSMKFYDDHFHCFGCQATGDVIE